MRYDDLLITLAYFSIPIQLLISLRYYPLLKATPLRFMALSVLFALFILLCGIGHLLRALGKHGSEFEVLNGLTAAVSVATAVYLIPMIPNIMHTIQTALDDIILQEELNKNRKLMAFMGFLCHEIRNPLFAITSSIAFMKEGVNERDRINYIYAIEQSANLMLRLVNDVLDISKLESGKVELELKPFNVRDLLNAISASIQSQVSHMRGTTVAFTSHINENVPAVIEMDPARLLQIVYNLLSNASKFTEEGKIDFTVDLILYDEAFSDKSEAEEATRRVPSGEDNEYAVQLLAKDNSKSLPNYGLGEYVLRIVVAGTGCGIASDRVKDIFRPFNQSKVSDYRKHGGTGLGLSIIAQLVKVMSGRIQVDSKENKGSTFTVYLPVGIPSVFTAPPSLDTGSILNDSIQNNGTAPLSESLLDQHVLKIVVNDSGCGIASDRVQNIFRPFNQSKVSDYRKHGGTGLGLSIIAQLVKVMSGRIQVDSTENEGSTFTVYLPVGIPSAHADMSSLDTVSILHDSIQNSRLPPMLTDEGSINRFDDSGNCSADSPLMSPLLAVDKNEFESLETNRKVLVVDDNTVNRKILGRMLTSFKLEVEFATNGQEAVDILARTSDFGLVLMDLDMPVLDGISATRVIRNELGLKELPIIALTAFAVQTQAQEALDAGVTEFATKPILKEDLRQKCCCYLLNRTQEIV